MNEFEYVIKDRNGIHARPAGLLAKKASSYDFDVMLECNGKVADIKRLLAIMSMGIKPGDRVKLRAPEGKDISELKSFFEENL